MPPQLNQRHHAVGYLASLLFIGAFVFAFGAKKETRIMVAVLIFIAIVLSVLGK
jgi:hypothetical protein